MLCAKSRIPFRMLGDGGHEHFLNSEQAGSLLTNGRIAHFKASNVPRTPTWASLQSPYRQSVPGERVSRMAQRGGSSVRLKGGERREETSLWHAVCAPGPLAGLGPARVAWIPRSGEIILQYVCRAWLKHKRSQQTLRQSPTPSGQRSRTALVRLAGAALVP